LFSLSNERRNLSQAAIDDLGERAGAQRNRILVFKLATA
jgi:hypothetical protein